MRGAQEHTTNLIRGAHHASVLLALLHRDACLSDAARLFRQFLFRSSLTLSFPKFLLGTPGVSNTITRCFFADLPIRAVVSIFSQLS